MTDDLTPKQQYEKATPEPMDYDTQPEPLAGTSVIATLFFSLIGGGVILAVALLIRVLK